MSKTDLVGQKFGRLTVIKSSSKQKGRTCWECVCDCGNITVVLQQSLKNRFTTSCGCFHHELVSKDLLGKEIGNWTIISKSDKRSKKGYIYWNCKCVCGSERQVCAESLLNGKSNSCNIGSCNTRTKRICLHGHDTELWGRSEAGACRACIRDKHLRTHYGITIEEFNSLYELQKGKCAICDKELGEYRPGKSGFGNGTRIEVDHDHKKGKRVSVRGLLCGGRWAGCNRRLGRIDNVEWLTRVVEYLKNPPAITMLEKSEAAHKT